MSTTEITLLFSDGASRRLNAACGDSIVNVAKEAGLHLLTDCANGQCGTCTASLISGDVDLDHYDRAVLPDEDRACGSILACVSKVMGPCVVEMPYELAEAMAEEMSPIHGRVEAITQVAAETVKLEIAIESPMLFHPGQYVRIRPTGADDWRSYSMANAVGSSHLVFYVRLVPHGIFSTWLTSKAAVGDAVELSEPHGSFFLRDEPRPRLFVAGGTGLAPFLAMLHLIAGGGASSRPTTLLLGVRTGGHLFAMDELDKLRASIPDLSIQYAAETEPADICAEGYATDLIKTLAIAPNTRVYLCGPPLMVEAGRTAAVSQGLARNEVLCERFA
jgi:benzoate/toluate 1,2-dioxygenase reductase subunit